MSYQLRRRVNCKVRAPLPEFRVASMPVLAMVLGFPGWFSTLKKSTFKRTLKRSLIGTVLNNEASSPHWRMLGRYCCLSGSRPLNVVRCVVPSLIGTQTVLVFQKDATLVPTGALGGSAVCPYWISGATPGL